MIRKTKDNIYTSSLLEQLPHITHGFTTKKQGNLADAFAATQFFTTRGFLPHQVTSKIQTHSSCIHIVKESEIGSVIPLSDGLAYKKTDAKKTPVLVVRVGDCIPLLAVDPVQNIIGAVHGGWKGTLGHIGRNLIDTFVALGSRVQDIRVAFGPSICGACYSVDHSRAELFQKEFKTDAVVRQEQGVWHLDLLRATYQDLLAKGITANHIDFDAKLCTFERPDEFFSYRRKNEPFGEIIGYIGFC